MHRRAPVVVCGVIVVSAVVGLGLADAQESYPPTFTKGKFAVPVNRDAVTADWTARGYSPPEVKPYAQGWARGDHTHPVHLVLTVVTGRMELLMAGQRFVVEPGDELFYPAHMVHSAIQVAKLRGRCVMYDPDTLAQDLSVLERIVTEFGGRMRSTAT